MPPIHRMPAFYVVAAVALAALGVGLLTRGGARAIPTTPGADRPPPTVAEEPAGCDTSDGILRTDDCLRRKVMVTVPGLRYLDRPDAVIPGGEPLDYPAILYVYGEGEAGGRPMVRVGKREGPALGWVPAESVLEWDTRLMARPTPRAGRPPLVIYSEQPCLLDALAGRACPRHAPGACPTEGSEPPRAPDEPPPPMGLPILQSKAIPQPDGSTRTIFEVASLVIDRPPPPSGRPDLPPDLLAEVRRIYIAFAIDTTRSMGDQIAAARRMAADLVARVEKQPEISLELALVEYRDKDYGYTARIVSRFDDPRHFLDALNRINAADRGDGSTDEAVFDGVAAALPGADGGEHLDWPTGRAGDLATKMLVLLGDAPDHATDLKRAEALAKVARDAQITIAAVSVEREPGYLRTIPDGPARYRDQWEALARDSYRPRDKASGFRTPLPPLHPTLAREGPAIADQLRHLIDDRIEQAQTIAAALARAQREGLLPFTNRQGLTLDEIWPVLEARRAAPEPRPDGGVAPAAVRKGWIAERMGGEPLVEVEVWMSAPELDALIHELIQLQEAAQGTAGEVAEMLRIGNAAASGETAFFDADRGRQTFAQHLRRREGLPPARPGSLLDRTQADLAQADTLDRAALDARLASGIAALVSRRHEPDWDDPRRTVDGMALVPYRAIDF